MPADKKKNGNRKFSNMIPPQCIYLDRILGFKKIFYKDHVSDKIWIHLTKKVDQGKPAQLLRPNLMRSVHGKSTYSDVQPVQHPQGSNEESFYRSRDNHCQDTLKILFLKPWATGRFQSTMWKSLSCDSFPKGTREDWTQVGLHLGKKIKKR